MELRFLRVDGEEPAERFVAALGAARSSSLFGRLRVLRDISNERRLPRPLFDRPGGREASKLGIWKVTLDYESEAYFFLVRRVGETWYVIHALRDRSADGNVPASDLALAVARWKEFDGAGG